MEEYNCLNGYFQVEVAMSCPYFRVLHMCVLMFIHCSDPGNVVTQAGLKREMQSDVRHNGLVVTSAQRYGEFTAFTIITQRLKQPIIGACKILLFITDIFLFTPILLHAKASVNEKDSERCIAFSS